MNICARIIQLINSRLFALVSTPAAGTHVFLVDSGGEQFRRDVGGRTPTSLCLRIAISPELLIPALHIYPSRIKPSEQLASLRDGLSRHYRCR